jgi:hypothetical protein
MLLSIQPLSLRGWFKIKSPHFIFASGLILFRGKDYILLADFLNFNLKFKVIGDF